MKTLSIRKSVVVKVALILMLGIFNHASAHAADFKKLSFACATDPLTTSFVFYGDGDMVHLRVIHHNGVDYMPLNGGTPVTPADLPMLQKTAKALTQLGDKWELEFKRKNCKTGDSPIFSCIDGEVSTVNGIKVDPYAVYSTVDRHVSADVSWTTIDVTLMFDIGNDSYTITMPYNPGECPSI